ncbi:Uncharacterized protein APZ42_025238 [Daphnia magna]|uniref:Uncharacterized protein n=1 Tax=Daphnia magna TaxID=35525 RepID=A0A164TBC7_9CRUS|nr:Uncharacterized protein APZ42_025238 [Daphnia magna]
MCHSSREIVTIVSFLQTVQDHRHAGNLIAENRVDECSSNNLSNSTQKGAEVDFPTHAAAAEDFFHDEFLKYLDCSSELQLDMNHEGSDDNEHDKQSYSSTVDDMRCISETTSEDQEAYERFRLSYYSNSAYNFLLSKNPGKDGLFQDQLENTCTKLNVDQFNKFQVLKIIKENIAAKKPGTRFSLVLGEMAVRRALGMGRKMKSYMGLCFLVGGEGDKEKYAQKCLVFLIVCLDGSGTRYIVSYWFTDSEAGSTVSKRVTECLTLTHEYGIEIRGIVFDGLPANIAMVNAMGANIGFDNPRHWISHPSTTSYVIYIFLDACHMLKLALNVFGDFEEIFLNGFAQPAKWSHIIQLHNDQHEMKVSYAAQLLSRSVAEVIDDGRIEGRPGFENSESTAFLGRTIVKLFDFCNSRSPLATGQREVWWTNTITLHELQRTDAGYCKDPPTKSKFKRVKKNKRFTAETRCGRHVSFFTPPSPFTTSPTRAPRSNAAASTSANETSTWQHTHCKSSIIASIIASNYCTMSKYYVRLPVTPLQRCLMKFQENNFSLHHGLSYKRGNPLHYRPCSCLSTLRLNEDKLDNKKAKLIELKNQRAKEQTNTRSSNATTQFNIPKRRQSSKNRMATNLVFNGNLKIPSRSSFEMVLKAEHIFQLTVVNQSPPPTSNNLIAYLSNKVINLIDVKKLFPTLQL